MLVIQKRFWIFTKTEYWFATEVQDVSREYDCIEYLACPAELTLPHSHSSKHYTLVLDLTNELESIWRGFNKTTRNEIMQAQRIGIKVSTDNRYKDFIDSYERFAHLKGLAATTLSPRVMPKLGILFSAQLDGQILSQHYFLSDDKYCRSYLLTLKPPGANRSIAKLTSRANRLLIWEAIKSFKAGGFQIFDFGGYYMGKNENDPRFSINFFKKGFGGTLAIRYDHKIYNSQIYKFVETIYKRKEVSFLARILSRTFT
jgi:hypothetical protein